MGKLRLHPGACCSLLLLLCLAPFAAAQSGPVRIVLFQPPAADANAETREHEELLAGTLEIELKALGYELVPPDEWRGALDRRGLAPADLADNQAALAAAGEVSAELAFVSSILVDEGRLYFQLKVLEVPTGAQLVAVLRSGRAGLTAYNVVNRAVTDTQDELLRVGGRRLPDDVLIGVLDHGIVERVVLESTQEGMEILFAGQSLGRITNGSLLLPFAPFPVGSEVTITRRLEGYHTERQTIRLPEKDVRISLAPLYRRSSWGAELNWTIGQNMGAGLGIRRYLLPDELYLSLDGYSYVQHDFREGSSPVYHQDLRFLLGYYLFGKPSSDFRFALTSGAGVILTFFGEPGLGSYTDYYVNLFNPTIELNLDPVSLYWRPEFRFALGIGHNLLGRRMIDLDERSLLWTIGAVYKW